MKRITTTLAFVFTVFSSFAQNNLSKEILVRHDTTTLKAVECEWIFKPQARTVKSVPQVILESVQSGKLKAYDPQTNELIPGNKIYAWRQAADTLMVWDARKEENVIKVIQHKINPEHITRIRVYQDWYLNMATGKIASQIKMFEMMGEVRTPSSGDIMGYQILYRVQY
ncbi:MAG: hypothetical protein IPI68_10005 [Chitinophagaceae bacterium]|nr:hypothetical protein [Chitinophagaceae bacterium]